MGRRGRRQSWGWWAVFLGACLAMAVYIAFDVIDLDASTFREPDLSSAVADDLAQDEAQRALATPLESPGLISSSLTLPSVEEVPRPLPPLHAVTSTLPLQLRPRAHVGREAHSTASSATEPA